MEIHELSSKLARAVADPAAAARWLRRQVVGEPPKKPKGPANVVTATLEKRFDEIRKAGHRRVAVHGDHATFDAAKAVLLGCELTWFSAEFNDLAEGASALRGLNPTAVDAFLVAGGDVAANYRHVVRWMAIHDKPLPAYWVSDTFEFCAGTVPIVADCDDADIDIFNHFSDFLGMREPLLVRIEVFDKATTITRWVVLRPRQAMRIKLSQWLPRRQGPACVFHYCAHPTLTRGRHYRWRATGHLYWNGSVAMVHGDHDFRGAGSMIEHKVGAGSFRGGQVVFSLPNYHEDLTADSASVETIICRQTSSVQRRADVRIDEIAFQHDGHRAEFDEFYGVKFKGYGGSFWFALDKGNGNDLPSLSANHSLSGMIRPAKRAQATPEVIAFVDNLRKQNIILDPHPLPVEPKSSPVEFGFEFDMNNPVLRVFGVRVHDAQGKLIGEGRYHKQKTGPVFAAEILDALKIDRDAARLIVLSPDWIAAGADPRGRGAAGNLVARLRATGDYEMTEFQNCWRNVGVKVSAIPHWLSQDRMLAGRTNVMCGIPMASEIAVGVSVTNGSGCAEYSELAEVSLRLIAPNGVEMQASTIIPGFSHRLLWLDEVMPEWRRHLPDGFGTLIVQSADADLNTNVVTVRKGRAVTLQHMWGY